MPTMTMDRHEQALLAGKRLREMRAARGWTAMDIEKKTREFTLREYGEDRAISETQNGRIENGSMQRVSFEDAMKLARVYEITPQEMAVIFGWWPEGVGEKNKPKEFTAAEVMYNTLEDEGDKAEFLMWIGFQVANMRSLLRMRKRGLGTTPTNQKEWGSYRSVEED